MGTALASRASNRKSGKGRGFMKKRLICLSLVLALLLGALPASAQSAYGGLRAYSGYTTLLGSSENKIYNVSLAASRLNGYVLELGETFSFNDVIGPRTAQWGYKLAENGRGARVRGGGAAQLATTVYQAVRQAGIADFSELHFYGDKFADNYAVDGDSAVLVDYANEQDMAFFNSVGTMTFYTEASEYGLSVTVTVGGNGAPSTPSSALISSAYTIFSSGEDQQFNAMRAASAISGVRLAYGQEFSFNDLVGERSAQTGYRVAVNGRGARVRGGGVAQTASTIYLAIRDLDCVRITEKHTYGQKYNQNYVASSDEAILLDYGDDDLPLPVCGPGRFAQRGSVSNGKSVVLRDLRGLLAPSKAYVPTSSQMACGALRRGPFLRFPWWRLYVGIGALLNFVHTP